MDEARITPVILCGGSGTRLWPRSRPDNPKPFQKLVGETTLFEEALSRCADAMRFGPPIIVTGAAHQPLVEAQCSHADALIIVEPCARNTAAAIALAALRVPGDTLLLVCPSDQHVADTAAFDAAVSRAAGLAQDGWLVTFGIEPTRAETGFGYIARGESLGDGAYRVAQFTEKPDAARAAEFLAGGRHDWNGGIFLFRADRFLEELAAKRADIAELSKAAVDEATRDGRILRPGADSFARIDGTSIDYAVMERTDRAAMVPVSMGWSDIGNWQALHDARPHDASGNSVSGSAQLVDCHNVAIDSDGPRVSAIGLENIVIVVNGGEVLVTTMDGAQAVGTLDGANGK
ncbi:sugar phosphate nucleotidyltransferase [Alteriqipengyuania sp. WL0013]|uniref:mannose-1-phosphate guanylyltransferase n=1 Tax=Alteriqipengyuania sp. WL0013 TaxID=3110773 RepID=UPI002C997C4A|nr:sugar phosphate nucleotidyltransferase [Alteriqipengyuania sp. WL0013]MEB3416580.1 sugar phosphate nucleotidyltransferase [Alteriqipengyuania sp. WL0013]